MSGSALSWTAECLAAVKNGDHMEYPIRVTGSKPLAHGFMQVYQTSSIQVRSWHLGPSSPIPSPNHSRSQVNKRYSDFTALHDELKEIDRGVPALPRKHLRDRASVR